MAAIELFGSPLFNDSNIVSYYRMEGNSNDAKDGNNGTDTNITYSSANGKFNQGAGFNGSTSHIDLGNPTNLQLNSDFTLHTWVNFTALPGSNLGAVFFSKEQGTQRSYYFVQWNDVSLGQGVRIGVSSDGTTDGVVFISWVPSTSTWYMVDAVYNKSAGSALLYVNGAQQGTTQTGLPTSIFNSTTHLQLGLWPDLSNYPLSGKMDEPTIFKRALTATEISNLFNGTWPFLSTLQPLDKPYLPKWEAVGY